MAGTTDDLRRIARDPAAFEVFYRRHAESVSRFVARRVTDPHTVDDVTTEVFLAAIDTAGSYRPERGSEVAWLFGIARNVVAIEQRRAARELWKHGLPVMVNVIRPDPDAPEGFVVYAYEQSAYEADYVVWAADVVHHGDEQVIRLLVTEKRYPENPVRR
ncbi:RNA polymerase sigma factor [Nonomuraea harbinensis]|uniref:RNA polymerase sigma factor n=1 Tax=Nonomuraea harbinensis TaxID=1286938 RepID=A0ABW1C5P0_9ACTN|nr:sigma factor [Nonomuraea harbinensis]